MAKIPRIQFKRTKSPGVKPSKDILAEGELAINLADRMLFTKSGEEIIDLGFAKGGTVNGDIIQETGNFTTNGTIRLKDHLNINGPDNKALNIAYDSRGPLIGVNEGDNKWKVLKIPAETGTFASREWVNTFVKSGSIQTDLKAPDNTTVLTINNSKLLSFKDGTADIFAVDIKGGYMRNSLIISGQNDYPGITLQKNDTFKVRIETDTDSTNTLLAFAYRDSDNSNIFVIKMPKEPGTNVLATQSWVDNKYYHKDSSFVSFRDSITLSRSAGKEKLIIEYNGSNGQWRFAQSADGSTNWMRHVLPTESGTFATREWTNTMIQASTTETMLRPPKGTHNIAITNTGSLTTWNGSYNPLMVTSTGEMTLRGGISAGNSIESAGMVGSKSPNGTVFGIFTRDNEAFLSAHLGGGWVELHHPKTRGTIATQEWSNSNHYKKAETYNKSEIDGKVNGRLTQAQGDARYYTKTDSDGRYLRMNTTNKTSMPVFYRTANYGDDANQRDLNYAGFYRTNGLNSLPSLIIHVPHSSGLAHGRGIGFDYGSAGYGIYTYAYDANGKYQGQKTIALSEYHYSKTESDGRYYQKSQTYSRAEVDSRVNGRLTQSQADGRYAYKGGATGQNFGANIVDAADVNIRSDISVKSNLVYIKNALDLLKPLIGYKYDLRLNDNTYKKSVGIIAQDVQKVLPELVQKDSTDLLSVNYNGLTAVLINAVNELNNRLKELEVKNGSNRTQSRKFC